MINRGDGQKILQLFELIRTQKHAYELHNIHDIMEFNSRLKFGRHRKNKDVLSVVAETARDAVAEAGGINYPAPPPSDPIVFEKLLELIISKGYKFSFHIGWVDSKVNFAIRADKEVEDVGNWIKGTGASWVDVMASAIKIKMEEEAR